MKSLFVTLLILQIFFSSTIFAEFDYNSNCKIAYAQILSLKIDAARETILAEKSKNPKNAICISLDNYVDFFSLFCSDNREEFDQLKTNKELRLAILEKESKNSPWYRYSIADLHIQWAITRFKFQENTTAALELNKAYKLLNENQRLYPNFDPNLKGLGMLNVLLGALPENYQTILSKIGMSGSTSAGINMLMKLVQLDKNSPYYFLHEEAILYLSFVNTDLLKNQNIEIPILPFILKLPTDNLLKYYLLAKNYAKIKNNDSVIRSLALRPIGKEYLNFYYLDYLMGIAKLNKLELNGSVYLDRFVLLYKGINNIKDAYLKLSWYNLIAGKKAEADKFNSLVLIKGYSFSEKDKQAIAESKLENTYNITLLKARLQYDGGYFLKSELLLSTISSAKFSKENLIEYNYRFGRIYQAEEKYVKAIDYYNKTINSALNQKNYFASNSALQLGLIYEKLKKTKEALYYYELCLAMKDHEYKNSIDNQAKIGVKRLKNQN